MPRTSFAAPFASRGMNAADVRPPLANRANSMRNPATILPRRCVASAWCLGLSAALSAKAYSDAGLQVFGADIDERSLAAATAKAASSPRSTTRPLGNTI